MVINAFCSFTASNWIMKADPDQLILAIIIRMCSRGTFSGCGYFFFSASVCFAIKALTKLIVGRKLADIFGNFGDYWREITNDDQARWVRYTSTLKALSKVVASAILNLF